MRRYLVLFALLPVTGCRPAGDEATVASAPRPARPAPLTFDPATLDVGDSVGAFRLARAAFHRASDSVLVGAATFEGDAEVAGAYRPHPDDPAAPCLFADPESAARLPRLPHDERQGWFCFSNPAEASVALRLPDGGSVRVVIDSFVYVFERSDVNNSARFVRALPSEAD